MTQAAPNRAPLPNWTYARTTVTPLRSRSDNGPLIGHHGTQQKRSPRLEIGTDRRSLAFRLLPADASSWIQFVRLVAAAIAQQSSDNRPRKRARISRALRRAASTGSLIVSLVNPSSGSRRLDSRSARSVGRSPRWPPNLRNHRPDMADRRQGCPQTSTPSATARRQSVG